MCTVYLFQKSNKKRQKHYFNFFSCCSLLQRKISVFCFPVYLFQKSKTQHKNIISISFLVGLFCKGKSLCTISLFQKSKTQKYHFNFFSCCSLLQRKIFVYYLPFSKEYVTHKHKSIISISFLYYFPG